MRRSTPPALLAVLVGALVGGVAASPAIAAPTAAAAPAKGKADAKGKGKADAQGKGKRGSVLGSIDDEPASDDRDAPRDPIARLDARLGEVEAAVALAEKIAAASISRSEKENAKRLVAGQVHLEEGDPERAAIVFLELVESYADTPAGIQARHFLGEALYRLDMRTWASECLLQNIADDRPDARRYHQASLARLLDLAAPRQSPGFARPPGLSALPELRGRLRALGLATAAEPPRGVVDPPTLGKVRARVAAIAPEERTPELRYANGRYLYFAGEHREAIAELDALSPLDIPLSRGGPGAAFRVRAAYVAAVAALAVGDVDDAMERLGRLVKASPKDPADRRIVELAWLARARINHDRGEYERSLQAYRRIGRSSPFYFTAVYETAWTLLRADRYDQAAEALDRLLELEPDGALTPEIKQLRGKLRIKEGKLSAAEGEFEALRQDFERRGKALASLDAPADYFAAIAAAEGGGFQIGGVLPRSLVPIARTLPRAVQAEALARAVGELDRELSDLRALLARMESAVQARERARLFIDLGAQEAALERGNEELAEVAEALIARAGGAIEPRALASLEERRKGLKARIDRPLSADERAASPGRRLADLLDFRDELEAAIGALRAELVGAEQRLLAAAERQKGSAPPAPWLDGVIELRRALVELQAQARRIREELGRVDVSIRYDDPVRQASTAARAAYRAYLDGMLAAVLKARPDPVLVALQVRTRSLSVRLDAARGKLDAAALARLNTTLGVLREERANLDRYRDELLAQQAAATDVVGEVMRASVRDVAAEVENWKMRSEVGKLDVAWAMKEAEGERARDLERQRERDLREVDRAIEAAKEVSR